MVINLVEWFESQSLTLNLISLINLCLIFWSPPLIFISCFSSIGSLSNPFFSVESLGTIFSITTVDNKYSLDIKVSQKVRIFFSTPDCFFGYVLSGGRVILVRVMIELKLHCIFELVKYVHMSNG